MQDPNTIAKMMGGSDPQIPIEVMLKQSRKIKDDQRKADAKKDLRNEASLKNKSQKMLLSLTGRAKAIM